MKNMLERMLKSKAEVAVLGVVLFSDGLHLREIARRAGISPSEAKKALDNFAALGVLLKSAKGNMSVYWLNANCPFLEEVKGIYVKTEGVVPLLAKELREVRGVKCAFVYGSFASGKFREGSDVDVLVVGNAEPDEVDKACFAVQAHTMREINYVLWSENEFKKKVREGSAFIVSVLGKPRIWLAGDENEFERTVEKA